MFLVSVIFFVGDLTNGGRVYKSKMIYSLASVGNVNITCSFFSPPARWVQRQWCKGTFTTVTVWFSHGPAMVWEDVPLWPAFLNGVSEIMPLPLPIGSQERVGIYVTIRWYWLLFWLVCSSLEDLDSAETAINDSLVDYTLQWLDDTLSLFKLPDKEKCSKFRSLILITSASLVMVRGVCVWSTLSCPRVSRRVVLTEDSARPS